MTMSKIAQCRNSLGCGKSMSMKVLVSGGAGFIGSQLALQLEKNGDEVTIVDDFFSAHPENLIGFRGQVLKQDISASFQSSDLYDAIFHQAAITDPRHPSDNEVLEKNINGFQNILNLAGRNQAKVVYASTAGLYGNGPVPMREDQLKDCSTAYARSKLEMEKMAEEHKTKLHLVGLRYFNVFGPNEAHKGRPASMMYHLWRQMRQGNRPRLFKWGEQIRDFIYVKDVVAANLCALTAVPGVYNVGTGVGTSFNELVTCLNKAMGTQLEPEYFDMPFDEGTYQHHTLADVEKAKKGLKFQAKWKLAHAVKDYIDFLDANVLIP